MATCENIINHAIMETLAHKNNLFPISEFVDHFDTFPNRGFPSHWHHELEVQVILHGSAEYRINGESFVVKEGCGIYIAPKTVHMAQAQARGTIGYNVILQPQFLINLMGSINCGQYAAPLTVHGTDAFIIAPDRKEGHNLLECMRKLYYTESTHQTYELILLENLIGIWRNLLAIFPQPTTDTKYNGKLLREQRMKIMLDYIHKNYAQTISISDIAASANISQSECFRCFAEFSTMTPAEYTNRFRLLQASQMLLTTEKSILDICYATGFNNTSYFSKKFREQYRTTPRAYRAKNAR